MKLFTYTLILLYFYIFSSCKGDSSNSAPFDGVFVTESGIKFELKEDSTTLILFDDTLNYEGVWSIHPISEAPPTNTAEAFVKLASITLLTIFWSVATA